MRLTDGEGGSVVVEASGNDNAIASIFEVAGHSARVRLIGHSIGRKVPVEIGRPYGEHCQSPVRAERRTLDKGRSNL